MSLSTAEEIYEQIVRPLPTAERLRLIARIAHDLSVPPTADEPPGYDWMALRGVAPNLLDGADAQSWVSRSRREADEGREQQWRGEP